MATQRSVRTRLTLDVNDYVAGTARAEASTQRFSKNATSLLKGVATGYAAIKLGGLITQSVTLEAAYSKTMAQVAVATNAPKSQLKDLDALALKLGADTVFSAQDAATAMLNLAKGGLSTAQIKAGALSDTLTLASAGELELGDASKAVVNAMGAFHLKASQTDIAVAALAGSANASSAEVSDMTQALAQTGTTAASAGLSIQDTTAYLALFANQGFKGSDAGTSLRTMLSRLVPQTDQAKAAMKQLGLTYLDANGNLVDAQEIAKRTQDAFKGLNDQQRISAVQAIFGQDAQRAVNAITAEGDEGLRKYLKSTSDLTQAQKLADAANSGTAGSLEQLKGTIETAEIQFGKGLAPSIRGVANDLNGLVSNGDFEKWAAELAQGTGDIAHELQPLAVSLLGLAQEALPAVTSAGHATINVLELAADIITPLVDGFNKLPDSAQKALILAAGTQTLGRRLGVLPGLSAPAGAGLFNFGGKAEKTGEQAEKAGGRLAGLAGSLKTYAALAGIALAVDKVPEAIQKQFGGGISDKDARTTNLAGTIGREGQTTGKTLAGLKAQLKDSELGKNADKFGISLDRLAKDMLASGDQGKYLTSVMDQLGKKSRENGPLDAIKGPWSDPSAAVRAKKALKDVVDVWDDVGVAANRSGREFNETRNELLLAGAGIDKYRDVLRELPTTAVTAITAPGALKTKEQIISLAREFNLTPRQVTTIMKVSDADFTKKQIQQVLTYLEKADGKKATGKLDVTDLAGPKIKNVRQLLDDVDGTVARSEIINTITTIKKSFTDKGVGHQSIKDMLTPYTGMRLPSGYASGGKVPGTPPSDPTLDNVWAQGANTGQILRVRSGEWILNQQASQKNDRWLALMNRGLVLDDLIPGFADGGRYDNFTSLTQSSQLELLQQQQRIRDLEKSLKERETVGKGKNKHKRLALRGLDRRVAEAELRDEKAELARMRKENAQLKNYGTPAQEKARNDADQAAQEQADAIKTASGSITDLASLNGISSAAGLERALTTLEVDSANFISVLSDLKKAGASDLVLSILQKAGPSKTSIRVGRELLADSARFARVNAISSNIGSLGDAYGSLTAGTGTLTAAQSSVLVQIQALEPSTYISEIQRVVRHEMTAIGLGAGISSGGTA